MDQKSIVLYLAKKGMTATEIHTDLMHTLKEEAVHYSSVTRYLRSTSFTSSTSPKPEEPPDREMSDLDEAILTALGEQPFASVRQLAAATHLAPSTVYWHLTHKLGFTVRHLRSVPHTLSTLDMERRVACSNQLLTVLNQQRPRHWRDIVTLDESWFYFHTDYETIWLPQGATPPERERQTIQSKKMMVTIVWNPTGFYQLYALPKGAKFNSAYYISEILTPLVEWRSQQGAPPNQPLLVHADNARPHTSRKVTTFFEENGLERAPHPPYSPDLAPCDFYLFGYIKGQLRGQSFDDGESLLRAIEAIFQSIPRHILESVFTNWEKRLKKCFKAHGGIIDET
jgi:transposase